MHRKDFLGNHPVGSPLTLRQSPRLAAWAARACIPLFIASFAVADAGRGVPVLVFDGAVAVLMLSYLRRCRTTICLDESGIRKHLKGNTWLLTPWMDVEGVSVHNSTAGGQEVTCELRTPGSPRWQVGGARGVIKEQPADHPAEFTFAFRAGVLANYRAATPHALADYLTAWRDWANTRHAATVAARSTCPEPIASAQRTPPTRDPPRPVNGSNSRSAPRRSERL